jgi:hypothetical protein
MNSKGQEEITGFILIVVIVAIIIVIFLAIFLRQNVNTSGFKDNRQIAGFIESAMEYTSDCAIGYEPAYSNLGELIKECRAGRQCISGKMACNVLNSTLTEIIDSGWQVGSDRPVKGYKLGIVYSLNSSNGGDSIMSLGKGECKSNREGAEYFSSDYPGNVITRLEICY